MTHPGPDIITFAAAADVQLTSGTLDVTSKISITGVVGDTIRRTGATKFSLFTISAAGNLTLANLTLKNGLAQGANGANAANGGNGNDGQGGAVLNNGTFSANLVIFDTNQAIGGKGGDGSAGTGGQRRTRCWRRPL